MSLDMDLTDAIVSGDGALRAIPDATAADPSWPEKLAAMEHAFVVLHVGFGWSTLAANDDNVARLRSLRIMVDEWLTTGQRPAGIDVAADVRRAIFRQQRKSTSDHS